MPTENSKSPKKTVTKKAVVKDEPVSQSEAPQKKVVAKKAAVKKAAPKKKAVKKTDNITISFQVVYSTRFGQNIFLAGNIPALGNSNAENALKLNFIDAEHWGAEIKIEKSSLPKKGLEYTYIVENEDGSVEESATYHLNIAATSKHIHVVDAWNYSGFIQNAFSTKVFKIMSDKIASSAHQKSSKKATHTFKIIAPELPVHHAIFISGSHDVFGNWSTENLLLLSPDKETGTWSVDVGISKIDAPVEYKYGIYDLDKKTFVAFEDGANRILHEAIANAKYAILNDGFLRTN